MKHNLFEETDFKFKKQCTRIKGKEECHAPCKDECDGLQKLDNHMGWLINASYEDALKYASNFETKLEALSKTIHSNKTMCISCYSRIGKCVIL